MKTDEYITELNELIRRQYSTEYVSTATFANKYSVSTCTVRRWCRQGMPHIKISKVVRIHVEQAKEWLAQDEIERLAKIAASKVKP